MLKNYKKFGTFGTYLISCFILLGSLECRSKKNSALIRHFRHFFLWFFYPVFNEINIEIVLIMPKKAQKINKSAE